MCGIAGFIAFNHASEQLDHMLDAMLTNLGHRGPDGSGRLVRTSDKWTVGLAHTRLSILDLSEAASQPMCGTKSPCWMTYNGEVYNFQALRRELKPLGHRFRSTGDSEVVLAAYETWGLGCLSKLRGMFGLGLWDEALTQLVLARDPFGIKPVYYFQGKDIFLFASEVRALLASGLVPRRLGVEGLGSYLSYGSTAAPLTIIDGIKSIEPGHALIAEPREGGLRLEHIHYANNLREPTEEPKCDRRQLAKSVRNTLEESVRAHLVSDVPLGVFLSGGLDSSALVALVSRVADERPRTFTVDFGEPEYSENSYAKLVATRFGAEHTEILLGEDRLLELLPDAFTAMDQPTMDGINTFVIAKAVREAGVKVALSGLGADELFAGYPSFRRAKALQLLRKCPNRIRSAVAAAGRTFLNGSVTRDKFWDGFASDGSAAATYRLSRQLFGDREIQSLVIRDFPLPISVGCADEGGDIINAVSVCEIRGYMANTLLRDTDFMGMAHGMEIRVPFVDPVVVRSVLQVPGPWKIESHRLKPLLTDAMHGLLPESILKRPKMGFTLPFERWMQSVLSPELDGAFSRADRVASLGLDPKWVANVWKRFRNAPQLERWSRSWSLYTLLKWCELNRVTL